MAVHLVRHAKAGSRREWHGPDDLRPLTEKGARQALGLVDLLAGSQVRAVLSSPSLRCVETVRPLAERLGLEVEESKSLAEGSDVAEAVGLLRERALDNAVLCSHRDVIPPILEALAASDGLDLPPDYPFAKASVWELQTEGSRVVAARYRPPPSGPAGR